MNTSTKTTGLLIAMVSALIVQACSDTTAELASPGQTGTNPGIPPAPPPPPPPPPAPPPPPPTFGCPVGTTPTTVAGNTQCILPATITSNLTLVAGFIYQLAGPTFVGTDLGGASTGTGVTLTIQPGVTVAGVGLNSVLVVPRGNRLVADGTQAQPIIFT